MSQHKDKEVTDRDIAMLVFLSSFVMIFFAIVERHADEISKGFR